MGVRHLIHQQARRARHVGAVRSTRPWRNRPPASRRQTPRLRNQILDRAVGRRLPMQAVQPAGAGRIVGEPIVARPISVRAVVTSRHGLDRVDHTKRSEHRPRRDAGIGEGLEPGAKCRRMVIQRADSKWNSAGDAQQSHCGIGGAAARRSRPQGRGKARGIDGKRLQRFPPPASLVEVVKPEQGRGAGVAHRLAGQGEREII